jgi:fatty acid desaturase
MLVVYGFYRFTQKQIGYRNDFCLTCNAERLTQQWRSFNCGHLFWIPLLPFGVFKRWLCPTCKNNPHARTESSRGFKLFAAGFFLLFALAMLLSAVVATLGTAPDFAKRSDAPGMWVGALVAGIPAAALTFWATRPQNDPVDLAQKLREVKPARTDTCPYCNSKLTSEQFCESCKLQRHEVTLP